MGDRALVVFTDGKEISPTVYLHWGGSKVPTLLQELAVLMGDRKSDVSYTCARFIGIVHSHNPNSNLSLGVWETSLSVKQGILRNLPRRIAKQSHGDAGVIVVNVDDFSWKAYGGYLAREQE